MPRVTWYHPPQPTPNYLHQLIRDYMVCGKVSSDRLGARMQKTGEAVRKDINRPVEQWRVRDLKEYCEVLHIPLAKAFEAVEMSLK